MQFRAKFLFGVAFLSAFSCQAASAADATREVSRAEFIKKGLTWPLDSESGTLGCTRLAVWFKIKDGSTYAVNGMAASQYMRINPIWSIDKKIESELRAAGVSDNEAPLRMDMTDLTEQGLSLCR